MDKPVVSSRGRPRSGAASSHAAIMDAVRELLLEKPARELTMDGVAKRAKVGKPTLYKWWPTKAALVMAMFNERIVRETALPAAESGEALLRAKARRLVREFNGLFGKVMADLIGEGQSEPAILRELYEQHMAPRRAAAVADIEQAKATGEFAPDTNPEMLVDAIFGPLYYRLLLRLQPLSEEYADELVAQSLRAVTRTDYKR